MSGKAAKRRAQRPVVHRPDTREVAVAQVTDKYSEYPSNGLTPVRLAEIFKEADAGDILRQAELFEEMEEKDPHLFSQLQTRKNAVTGLDFEIIPFDTDDERDKEIAEFVEAQINGIEGFEDIMLDLLDAVGKGFAVSEIMWSYDGGHVVVGDIRSRHQKRFFWDTEDAFKVRTDEAPEGIVFTTEPIRSTLPIGGGVGAAARISLPLAPDEHDFRDMLHTGGTFSVGAAIPVPEHTAQLPATTILRTGGVCTMISNLSSKGE